MFTTPLHSQSLNRTTRTNARRDAVRRATLRNAEGFSLIELLVVILIVAILAAIVIPSLLSQTSKATDAQAKELLRTAQTTAQTIATDHNASYEAVTPAELHNYENTIPVGSGTPTKSAWLTGASGSEASYSITATAPTGDTFTLERSSQGVITHSCTEEASSKGCPNGSW